MAANCGNLSGKVLFITGASRGIGRAIALKAARDGAKIAVVAKTKDPHPKLPGTIYSVADEITKLGGQALPCTTDIRFEDQVQAAIDQTVEQFGGIDILVNNASAISLTNTTDTSMKMYDLMMGINARGTYLCSKLCLPHLRRSSHAHILNISPPLNMSPIWFQNHAAYTMAKYGMSICVLGMTEELRSAKIAVNALWPRTAIYTAAMQMLGGGEMIASQCRKPEIVADAAYVVLCKDPGSFTGNFLIDDEVLTKAGTTDLESYSCVPGSTLLPDFFLDQDPATLAKQMQAGGAKPKFQPQYEQQPQQKTVAGAGAVEQTFNSIQSMISDQTLKEIGASFAFNLTGDEPGEWYLDLRNPPGQAGRLKTGTDQKNFDCQMELSSANFVKMFSGSLNPTQAFMAGSLKIKGNMFAAMKLEKLMKHPKAKL